MPTETPELEQLDADIFITEVIFEQRHWKPAAGIAVKACPGDRVKIERQNEENAAIVVMNKAGALTYYPILPSVMNLPLTDAATHRAPTFIYYSE